MTSNKEDTIIDIPINTNETQENNEPTKTIDTNEITKKNEKRKHIKFTKQLVTPRVYITGIVTFAIAIVCNFCYNLLVQIVLALLNIKANNSNEEGLDEATARNPIFMCIYIGLAGPILEELIFRRYIFWLINKYNKILAYLISSFLFAFAHFNFKFFTLFTEVYNFPIYFAMGALFAYAYDRDGCILASMIAHILHNSFIVIGGLLFS